MGINYNPRTVTDGMVLYLDAANPKNYNLTEVEVLVVAGGGGGGTGSYNGGGGGGGGGVIYNRNFAVTPGSAITVTVGDGGSINNNGGSSVFSTITSTGGGAGGGFFGTSLIGLNGGSGGGGGAPAGTGISLGGTGNTPSTSPPQGNSGGAGEHISGIHAAFGGGGGAGGIGGDFVLPAGSGYRRSDGGFGGAGASFSISGTSVTYAGGGGGGGHTNLGGIGGIGGVGGGGSGSGPSNAVAGTPNTGGGGGGQGHSSGSAAAGGSGIVIVRYPGPQKAIGGTITSNNGYTIHTFTTVGSTTFTPLVATNNSAILGLSDFSGNNRFGTTVNSPTYSSENGGYIVFDGTNDHITTGVTRGTLGNYLSISVWYKYLGTSGRTYSAIIGGKEPSAGTEFFIGKNTGNTNIGIQDGNYYDSFVTGSNAFDGNWHQLVYTYDNGTGKIYLDSVLKNTNSFTKCNDAEEIVIGGEIEGGGYYFEGYISSVLFHNRVLTAAEVQQNYNATRGRYVKGGINNPFSSPNEAQSLGVFAGTYYFKSGAMSSAQLLEYQPNYYESRPFCCVFRSPYRSTATTNKIDLNIPMGGLLVQRDTLDLRGAVYWSTPITYNTVLGSGNNTADSGTGYAGSNARRVMLGGGGGHGIYRTDQSQCNWQNSTGAIGAGWDGVNCGSFPNDLVWGTGNANPAYENRSGTWSHWITWS